MYNYNNNIDLLKLIIITQQLLQNSVKGRKAGNSTTSVLSVDTNILSVFQRDQVNHLWNGIKRSHPPIYMKLLVWCIILLNLVS